MANKKTKTITISALIAALYTALTLAVAPISFGAIQVRISEVLTVLPAIYPPSILGLTLGCFLSNLLGFLLGFNPIGLIDCAVGTSATLIAAILTYIIGKKISGKLGYVLAPLPPILVNAVFIGVEIAVLFTEPLTFSIALLSCMYVGLGQILPCYLGSVLLLKNGKKIFNRLENL